MVLAKVYRNPNEKKKQENIKWGSFPEENCHLLQKIPILRHILMFVIPKLFRLL